MSSETLSQQEIDALFSGGSSGVADASEPQPQPQPQRERIEDIQVYDFRRPNLISKDRLKALESMYGLMCKSLEGWLAARLRAQLELHLVSVEHFSYGEFVLSLPSPCSSFIFDMPEAGGQQGVIDFGREFSFFLIDRLLGGSAEPLVQDRVLTPLERMVVRIVADQAALQLNGVWQEHVQLNLTHSRFESMPDMLRLANREEPMLVANVQAKIGEIESTLVLCLPFNVLEKFFTGYGSQRKHTGRGTSKEREADRHAMDRAVRESSVCLAAEFPQFSLTMHDLAHMQAGHTMMTGLPHDAPLTVRVGSEQRFIGLPGRSGSRLAVRIKELIEPAPTNGKGATPTSRSIMGTTTYQANAAQGAPAAGVDFTELEAAAGGDGSALATLYKLTLPVTIELGRAQMTVQEVLDLARGSVVQLDRLVGEPVDVLVGDRRFAEGEVVVIGEQFGVRITRIISAQAALEGGR